MILFLHFEEDTRKDFRKIIRDAFFENLVEKAEKEFDFWCKFYTELLDEHYINIDEYGINYLISFLNDPRVFELFTFEAYTNICAEVLSVKREFKKAEKEKCCGGKIDE